MKPLPEPETLIWLNQPSIIVPFHRRRKLRLRDISNLPKVRQPGSGETGVCDSDLPGSKPASILYYAAKRRETCSEVDALSVRFPYPYHDDLKDS